MAGPNDFTNQNIQDTYQRVLQISSSGEVTDGTGSLVPILKMTASHAVVETSFETSSSYAQSASVADRTDTVTNSTNSEHYVTFVDSNNATLTPETHYTAPFFYVNPAKRFVFVEGRLQVKGSDIWIESGSISASNSIYAAGSITASGNISASGDINAGQGGTGSFDHIVTQGSTIEFRNGATKLGAIKMTGAGDMTIADSSTGKSKLKIADLGVTDASSEVRIQNGDITASGEISASSVIYASQFSTSGGIGGGSLQAANADGTVTIQHGNITASGEISASGKIIANGFTINTNAEGIQFMASNGNLFKNIATNSADDFLVQNLKNGENLRLRAGQSGNKGKVLIQQGGTSTGIASFGPTSQIEFNGDITASGNISSSGTVTAAALSIPAGNALLGSGSLTLGNASTNVTLHSTGHITASGTISASGGFVGDLTGNASTVTVATDAGNTTHYVLYTDATTGQRSLKADAQLTFNGATNTLSTSTLSATSVTANTVTPTYRKYTPIGEAEDSVNGDIISGLGTDAAGGADLLTAGSFYVLTNGLKWVPVDADHPSSSSGLIGYCITTRRTDFLIKGFIRYGDADYIGSTDGAPLYISTGSGKLQNCKPGSGDVARIVGYAIDASNKEIFMDPDKTWVKIT